jgi:hypothetical protein
MSKVIVKILGEEDNLPENNELVTLHNTDDYAYR